MVAHRKLCRTVLVGTASLLSLGAMADIAEAEWIQPVHLTISTFGAEGPDHVPGTSDDLPAGSLGISSGYNDGAYEAGSPPTSGAHVIMLSTAVPLGGDIWQYSWTLVNRGTGNFIEYTDEGGGPNFLQAPPLEPAISFETDSRIGGPPEMAVWGGRWYVDVVAPGGATYYRPSGSTCGNGVVEGSEQCDDGNTNAGDCCSSLCFNQAGDCSDGDVCNGIEICSGGICRAGSALVCDDTDVCTADTCDPITGCTHAANTDPCNDGNPCTDADTCSSGVCAGRIAHSCDDNNVCTDDSCDPASGCVNTNNASSCDDGDACTQNDMCSGGACVGGTAPDCDDSNACTTDSCDPTVGCTSSPNSAPCDDGNGCTTGDMCTDGVCVGGPPPNCDDLNRCTDDSCNAASGCINAPNVAPCDDGSACTTNDTCSAGSCVGGAVPDCDDGNLCTADSCDVLAGCVHANVAAPCDDSDACTIDDTCSAGACIGTSTHDCDDGNVCTTDSCDPTSGCVNTNNASSCDDGDVCTQNDMCSGGTCVGGAPTDCDDGNPCTNNSCDPTVGCTSNPNSAACDDGNGCTSGDMCTDGVCVGGPPPDCDDGNVCTDDTCDSPSGCIHSNNLAPCSDGDVCTQDDYCSNGQCLGHRPLDCSLLDDICNVGTCTTGDVCRRTPNPDANGRACDDGNPCIDETVCDNGVCGRGILIDCNDNNPCTIDHCSSVGGCIHTNRSGACDDGDACTDSSECLDGTCVGTSTLRCDDGNPCTDDTCDSARGCIATNNTAACSDTDACTLHDTCTDGRCMGSDIPGVDTAKIALEYNYELQAASLAIEMTFQAIQLYDRPDSSGMTIEIISQTGMMVVSAAIPASHLVDVEGNGTRFTFDDPHTTVADAMGVTKASVVIDFIENYVTVTATGEAVHVNQTALYAAGPLALRLRLGSDTDGQCFAARDLFCHGGADSIECGLASPRSSEDLPGIPRNGSTNCAELVEQLDVIDFEGLPAGFVLNEVFSAGGLGPVTVGAFNPWLSLRTNAAVVFDSSCPGRCSSNSYNLGTPHRSFGGPGRGSGGRPGRDYANTTAQGNLVIAAAALRHANDDGLVDNLDDQDDIPVALTFDFSAIAPVTMHSLTVIDIDKTEYAHTVTLFDEAGAALDSFELPITGNNGIAVVALGPVSNVSEMRVTMYGSAAIDDIIFAVSTCIARQGR